MTTPVIPNYRLHLSDHAWWVLTDDYATSDPAEHYDNCTLALSVLDDSLIRDEIIRRALIEDRLDSTAETLSQLAMDPAMADRAGPDAVAAAFTIAAIARWTQGDDASAYLWTKLADLSRPEYRLAALIRESITAGLPVDTWKQGIRSLAPIR